MSRLDQSPRRYAVVRIADWALLEERTTFRSAQRWAEILGTPEHRAMPWNHYLVGGQSRRRSQEKE